MTEKTETLPPATQPDNQPTDAGAIHRRAVAIDMHADTRSASLTNTWT